MDMLLTEPSDILAVAVAVKEQAHLRLLQLANLARRTGGMLARDLSWQNNADQNKVKTSKRRIRVAERDDKYVQTNGSIRGSHGEQN